jgi:hypothetical protein
VAGDEEVCGHNAVLEEFEGWVCFHFNRDAYGSLDVTYGDDGGGLYM